ncbi:hypothetical protein DACRYDRAFT_109015 [Dacryopinax primogenitus]|uniref:Transmembrane protein n=1 Tax=Dacryopinax primogenitus (strain DJM 731) TaxID=1858805 RepID=M5G909_DACPD|nr:uncharacterized protein DACRYDRAFT_109015 [Dacryopinax primogenitus]EJU00268.1 hypothetical protein DACRYDRAFT_109015 [Dacryopinax primogenitus]
MVRSSTIVLTLTLAATAFAAPLSLERRAAPMEEHEHAMRSEMDDASLEKRFMDFIKSHPFITGAVGVAIGAHVIKKFMPNKGQPAKAQNDQSENEQNIYPRRDLQDDDEYLLEMRDMEDNTPWVVLRDANMEYVASTLEKRGSLSDME